MALGLARVSLEPTAHGEWWVRYGESTFLFRDDSVGLLMRLKNVRTDDGHVLADLFAQVASDAGMRTLLTRPRVNLTSDRTMPGLIKALANAGGKWGQIRSFDWTMLLERMCAVLVTQMAAKGTVTELRPRSGAELAQPMAFRQFIPANLLSALVAHGGTGKSLTGSMLALAVRTGRKIGPFEPLIQGKVLYLDWENDHELHERRLTRLCMGLGIDFPGGIIHYRAIGAKLTSAESDIVELAYEHEAVFTILDSIGFAAGSDLNSSDTATSAINTLKHVPGTKVMIAHVNKAAAMGLTQSGMPSGNTFFWNGCQAVYDLRASDPALDGSLVLAVHHGKANVGPKITRPLGARLTFDDPAGPITPEPLEIRGDSLGGEGMPLPMRIMDVLTRGAMSAAEVGLALGMDDRQGIDAIAKELRQLRHKERVVQVGSTMRGNEKWGLAVQGYGGPVAAVREGPDWCPICGTTAAKYDSEGQGWCRLHWLDGADK